MKDLCTTCRRIIHPGQPFERGPGGAWHATPECSPKAELPPGPIYERNPEERGITSPKRSASQKDADRAFVAYWLVRGATHEQILDRLTRVRPYRLSLEQIKYDVSRLKKAWRKSAMDMLTDVVARELAGLEEQERELWAAWEESKRDGVVRTIECFGGPGSEATKVVETGQCGDPAFMRLLLDIRERRARLLGLDKQEAIPAAGLEFRILVSPEELPQPRQISEGEAPRL